MLNFLIIMRTFSIFLISPKSIRKFLYVNKYGEVYCIFKYHCYKHVYVYIFFLAIFLGRSGFYLLRKFINLHQNYRQNKKIPGIKGMNFTPVCWLNSMGDISSTLQHAECCGENIKNTQKIRIITATEIIDLGREKRRVFSYFYHSLFLSAFPLPVI